MFPAWQRAAQGASFPNADVWGRLPGGVCWFEATIQEPDLGLLYLVGSADLAESFGTYRLAVISKAMDGDDPDRHQARVSAIIDAVRRGESLERPILVAESGTGPFLILDGNHRCLAYFCLDQLVGKPIYLGIAPDLFGGFQWARLPLAGTR